MKIFYLLFMLLASRSYAGGVKLLLDEGFIKSEKVVKMIAGMQYHFEEGEQLEDTQASFIYNYFAQYHQIHPVTKSSATDYNIAFAGDYAGSIGFHVVMEERGNRVILLTEKQWRRDLYKKMHSTVSARVSQLSAFAGFNKYLRFRVYEKPQAKNSNLKTMMIYIEKLHSTRSDYDELADQALEQLMYSLNTRIQQDLGIEPSMRILE